MKRIYHAFHHNYELTVQQSTDDRYFVIMKPDRFPPEENMVLHASHSEHTAVAAAKMFPELYQIAQIKGYKLQAPYFVNSNGKAVHISFAMEAGMTAEKFRAILDR